MLRALLLSATLCDAGASLRRAPARSTLVRLRGGSVDDTALVRVRGGSVDDKLREEIRGKLNGCPTFVVLTADDKPVGLVRADGKTEISWFTEPGDVRELLDVITAGNPEVEGLHIGCTPLGDAYEICGGWGPADCGPDEVRKIQGSRALVDEVAPTLVEQLSSKGLDGDGWQLPVFCHDDFQTDTLMPFFFSAEQLIAGWVRNGRPEEEAPQQPLMMDMRLLVQAMVTDASVRGKAAVVTSVEAYQLAQEIIDRAKAAAADDADEGGAGDEAEDDSLH